MLRHTGTLLCASADLRIDPHSGTSIAPTAYGDAGTQSGPGWIVSSKQWQRQMGALG
jgi:hypothetical protein